MVAASTTDEATLCALIDATADGEAVACGLAARPTLTPKTWLRLWNERPRADGDEIPHRTVRLLANRPTTPEALEAILQDATAAEIMEVNRRQPLPLDETSVAEVLTGSSNAKIRALLQGASKTETAEMLLLASDPRHATQWLHDTAARLFDTIADNVCAAVLTGLPDQATWGRPDLEAIIAVVGRRPNLQVHDAAASPVRVACSAAGAAPDHRGLLRELRAGGTAEWLTWEAAGLLTNPRTTQEVRRKITSAMPARMREEVARRGAGGGMPADIDPRTCDGPTAARICQELPVDDDGALIDVLVNPAGVWIAHQVANNPSASRDVVNVCQQLLSDHPNALGGCAVGSVGSAHDAVPHGVPLSDVMAGDIGATLQAARVLDRQLGEDIELWQHLMHVLPDAETIEDAVHMANALKI